MPPLAAAANPRPATPEVQPADSKPRSPAPKARFPATDPRRLHNLSCLALALLCHELGYLRGQHALSSGEELAYLVSTRDIDAMDEVRRLSSRATLIIRGVAQPCGGTSTLLSDDPLVLIRTDFELGDQALEVLGIPRRGARRADGQEGARPGRLRLAQLVLPPRVERAGPEPFSRPAPGRWPGG